MIEVTKQQIQDFVMAQPDDRTVRMTDCMSTDTCGCVMVQYAREHFGTTQTLYCTNTHWFVEGARQEKFATFEKPHLLQSVLDNVPWNFQNYGQLKLLLKQFQERKQNGLLQ